MSLVLAMIGLCIVSIILLAVFRLLDLSRDMATSFQNVIRSMDAVQEVRFAMADTATCTSNLIGLVPGPAGHGVEIPKTLSFPTLVGSNSGPPGTPASPVDSTHAATPIITFGGVGGNSVTIKRVTVSLPESGVANTAMINIEMERRTREGPQALRSRSVPVWIKQGPGGLITCCTSRALSYCP
jgi:hypothetical protein